MSVRAVAWALRGETGVKGASAQAVLVVLAEHAREDGSGSYPSERTIAAEARIARSTVQAKLEELADAGVIRENGRRRRRAVEWLLSIPPDWTESTGPITGPDNPHDRPERLARSPARLARSPARLARSPATTGPAVGPEPTTEPTTEPPRIVPAASGGDEDRQEALQLCELLEGVAEARGEPRPRLADKQGQLDAASSIIAEYGIEEAGRIVRGCRLSNMKGVHEAAPAIVADLHRQAAEDNGQPGEGAKRESRIARERQLADSWRRYRDAGLGECACSEPIQPRSVTADPRCESCGDLLPELNPDLDPCRP